MESSLMDKEVLCLLDTRQIQRYMFRSNSYEDILGGSDLMSHILDDGIRSALRSMDPPLPEEVFDLNQDPDAPIPYFDNEKICFQLMTCVAGNALFLARTGRLAQKLIRKISRYYLEHGYSLNLAAAAVEKTSDLGRDIFELYKKLSVIKTSGFISDPICPLPVVIREPRTGEPVSFRDPATGELMSGASVLRRREAAARGQIVPLKEMTPSKGPDGAPFLAVLHADGNNIGITVGKILQKAPDYREGIRARRWISRNLKTQFKEIVNKTVDDLRACVAAQGGAGDFAHRFQLVHNSGDDLNCMCSADLAFPFLDLFYKNLENACIVETKEGRVPLYCCAGICFVTPEHSFHAAFTMAEECCDHAKAVAKRKENLRDGMAGNWIDFQICEDPHIQELDTLRERAYVTDDDVSLFLRPYCLDEAARNEPYAYEKLKERVRVFRELGRKHGIDWLTHLYQSYILARLLFLENLHVQDEDWDRLEETLGEPYYRDEEKRTHAVWYDALTIMPFMAGRPAEGKGGAV